MHASRHMHVHRHIRDSWVALKWSLLIWQLEKYQVECQDWTCGVSLHRRSHAVPRQGICRCVILNLKKKKRGRGGVSLWGLQLELLQWEGDGLCGITFLCGGLGLFEGRYDTARSQRCSVYLPEPAEEQQQRRDSANIPGDQHQLKAPTSLPCCQNLENTW